MLWYITIFWKCIMYISENAHGIKYFASIWQSYINAISECLQSKKHCEAIMDNLLLFTPSKKGHMAKLQDLLKAFLKMVLKYPSGNVSYLKQSYNKWEILYL